MEPSEQAVKAAAEAIYANRGYAGCNKYDTGETRTVWYTSQNYARAALSAALPIIRQQLAEEILAADSTVPEIAGTVLAARIVRGDHDD